MDLESGRQIQRGKYREVKAVTIAEMKQKKAELGLTNEQVTMLSGVPLGTVQKVFGGTTTAPRYQTLRKLEAVFSSSGIPGTLTIRETAHEYMAAGKSPAEKKPGEYTVEDFTLFRTISARN